MRSGALVHQGGHCPPAPPPLQFPPMRIAVVFDTPYPSWRHADHERQMAKEVAAWRHDEPEMEYQIADALGHRGHEVFLIGVTDDLQHLIHTLGDMKPDLVFNA